jgi:hypothetical protein
VTDWVDALATEAPDVVALWRGIETGQRSELRRELSSRVEAGTAGGFAIQLAHLAEALAAVVADLSDDDLRRDGGEADWNVAQTIGHACDARAGLSLAAARAAADRWPADAPPVIPGVPGPADADREALLRRIDRSQRIVERSARGVQGHEADPCPLEHPLVGRLRCGEWLLFAGLHDLMHLEQLHAIMGR